MDIPGDLPSVDSLRCFVAAAKHLNFRKASREVALTPTAFSQRIKNLERQLGSSLFKRTTRSVRLTRAGLALLPHARGALTDLLQCMEAVHEEGALPVSFTIGTRFELGISWVVPTILDLEQEEPNWDMDFFFGTGPELLKILQIGEVDCIITSAPVARAEWTSKVLHPEQYVLVGAPELVKERPLETPEDARSHTLLDINRSLPLSRYLMDASEVEIPFQEIRICGSAAAMHHMIRRGCGVGVIPEYMVQSDLKEGTVVRLLPKLPMLTDTFRIIYAADHALAPIFESLAGYLSAAPLQ
jgi:DNA-binding transcriptional LysR family regulator